MTDQSSAEPSGAPASGNAQGGEPRKPQSWLAENWMDVSALGISGIALVVSIISAIYTWNQTQLAQRAYDRAVGKVQAKLTIVDAQPKIGEIPEKFKGHFTPGILPGSFEVTTLRKLDDIAALNPAIVVKNVGEEPVDAIRVETSFQIGYVEPIKGDKEFGRGSNPLVLNQSEREDHQLSRAMQPGEVAFVPIARGLLSQMLQAQNLKFENRAHLGIFRVDCFGRLVGRETFDPAPDNLGVKFHFVWSPQGFPKQESRQFVQEFRPRVILHSE